MLEEEVRAQRASVSSIEVVDELDPQDRPIHQDLRGQQDPSAYGLVDVYAPMLALPGTPQAAQNDDRSGHDSDMSSDEPVPAHDGVASDDARAQNFSSRVLEENSFSEKTVPGGFRCISCYAFPSHLLCSNSEPRFWLAHA